MEDYLSEKDKSRVEQLKELHHKYKLDAMECYSEETKQFYYGKAKAINEVLIIFYNIEID